MVCSERKGMRILLRQKSQRYLQPSGEWAEDRKTARDFTNSAAAYFWALEQQLFGAEVLMAFEDPRWDIVLLRAFKP